MSNIFEDIAREQRLAIWGPHPIETALKEVCEVLESARDLLTERKQGNPARSSGHNARLEVEHALALLAKLPGDA